LRRRVGEVWQIVDGAAFAEVVDQAAQLGDDALLALS